MTKGLTCKVFGHNYPDFDEIKENDWECKCERCGKELLTFVRMKEIKERKAPPSYTRRAKSFSSSY